MATVDSRLNTTWDIKLPNSPGSRPVAEMEEYYELLKLYQAIQNLTIELDRRMGAVFVTYSETATYGQGVNLYNNGGTLNARLSNLTTSAKPVRGFCSEVEGVASGSTGLVLLCGKIVGQSGLTPGALYYGSNTGGGYSTSAGTVSQLIGYALSDSELYINPVII